MVRVSPRKGSRRRYPRRVPDTVRLWLHLESAAALVAGVAIYRAAGGDWLWLVPLLLVPDISIAGYLANPAAGAFVYNVVHNFVVGLALVGLGVWADSGALEIAGAVLIAHVGGDRLLGYGLKHAEGFKDTHLQRA